MKEPYRIHLGTRKSKKELFLIFLMFKVEEWVLDYVVALANLNISNTNKS
jgi:hypothetical protein